MTTMRRGLRVPHTKLEHSKQFRASFHENATNTPTTNFLTKGYSCHKHMRMQESALKPATKSSSVSPHMSSEPNAPESLEGSADSADYSIWHLLDTRNQS
ncbi:hypothetical protein BITS_1847 [Bifidobacterium tsurumiense]|uniref:Uncharacterized protein n=1 Tax=Bifidobacterium tsurumiense TaxID=356829 RepID=A0A087EE28_9BIFI|nr:hypothetical protein BITS_1847 [Bifidobacterium tsurumiense]